MQHLHFLMISLLLVCFADGCVAVRRHFVEGPDSARAESFERSVLEAVLREARGRGQSGVVEVECVRPAPRVPGLHPAGNDWHAPFSPLVRAQRRNCRVSLRGRPAHRAGRLRRTGRALPCVSAPLCLRGYRVSLLKAIVPPFRRTMRGADAIWAQSAQWTAASAASPLSSAAAASPSCSTPRTTAAL